MSVCSFAQTEMTLACVSDNANNVDYAVYQDEITPALLENLTTNSNLEEGQLIALQEYLASNPDRVTAGILAILLGDFGVQHFYTGQTVRGILDILFCWTGIPAIIGLVEGIIWLCEDDAEFQARVAGWQTSKSN